jgi:hypothetical protein
LFGLTLAGFTIVHFYYIIRNLTSIEYVANRPIFARADFDKSGRNFEVISSTNTKVVFNQGFYYNWCSVMGFNPFTWLGKKKKKKKKK